MLGHATRQTYCIYGGIVLHDSCIVLYTCEYTALVIDEQKVRKMHPSLTNPFEIIVGTYEQYLLGYKVQNIVNVSISYRILNYRLFFIIVNYYAFFVVFLIVIFIIYMIISL